MAARTIIDLIRIIVREEGQRRGRRQRARKVIRELFSVGHSRASRPYLVLFVKNTYIHTQHTHTHTRCWSEAAVASQMELICRCVPCVHLISITRSSLQKRSIQCSRSTKLRSSLPLPSFSRLPRCSPRFRGVPLSPSGMYAGLLSSSPKLRNFEVFATMTGR